MHVNGGHSQALYILDNNNQLNEKGSDRIYGDDLHFSGKNTFMNIYNTMEIGKRIYYAISAYDIPKNKVSSRFDIRKVKEEESYSFDSKEDIRLKEQQNIVPLFTLLSYEVMEFKGKNYIYLFSGRYNWDKTKYPNIRLYFLNKDKRELQCTFSILEIKLMWSRT